MIKKFLYGLFLLLIFLGLVQRPIFAKAEKDYSDEEILQVSESGDFKLRDHPSLRVRVFVHNPKPSPSPSLVCNAPNPDSLAVVGSAGWHISTNTWTYTLNPGSVPSSVGSANLATFANDAYSRWQTAINNKVTFSRSSTDTIVDRQALDGKNIVAWGRTPGTALAVTYVWYYTATGAEVEADTIMNKKFSWSWVPPSTACVNANTYDAQDILTHELGHTMGLDDMYTSDYVNNTMYGYGAKGEIKKDTLTTGDVAGVQAIYP